MDFNFSHLILETSKGLHRFYTMSCTVLTYNGLKCIYFKGKLIMRQLNIKLKLCEDTS